MKIYTFQPNFVWEQIKNNGFYYPPTDLFEKDSFLNEEFNDFWGFRKSYEWLQNEMKNHGVINSLNNKNLIWAWFKWHGHKNKPDKRYSSVFNFYKEPFVMLELNIDSSRVFLSDYDGWHFVLNYWYLGKEKETEDFSSQFNYYKEKPLQNTFAHLNIEESWRTIFDMQKTREILEFNENEQSIQATFYEIFFNDVKKVHYFDNKRCVKIETISQ